MQGIEKVKTDSKKKTTLYKERDEEKRKEFREDIKQIPTENIVYVDESGLDNRLYKEYGYSKRGEKIFAEISGVREERINCIAGTRIDKDGKRTRVAPFFFKGSCNTAVFEAYVKGVLLVELKPEDVIVIDNASFHKSDGTKEMIEKAGCVLLFLPPYSPDMNLQEKDWANLKKFVRNNLLKFNHNLESIISAFFISQ